MFSRPRHTAVAVAIGLSATLTAELASADSHGNRNVHAREFDGETYVMYRNHMSLYTYDKDPIGLSMCNDACTDTWIPAILDAGTKLGESYSLIVRPDGKMQAAFRGKPLYLYSKDRKPGDKKGDGVNGEWHLARP